MADPLSIASGIAGLLSLGIQTTQALVDFYSAYKDQNSDLAKMTRNLESLGKILRSLDVAVQARQSSADAQDLLKEIALITQRCEEIIQELNVECKKFEKDSATTFKGRIQVAGRRVAYPFRKSTLQKLEEDTGEIRETLSLAMDVVQLKTHNEIQDDISDLKALLERTNATQVSVMIRSWLMAPDASLNHNTACAKRHEDTGLWLINSDQFASWLAGHNSFLWLHGFAGCGKSVLCSTAIQHTFHKMKHRKNVGIAFFYFSFTDEAKQDVDGMLRTLLLQLSVQLQDGEKDLEQLHTLHRSSTPSVEVLLNLLHQFAQRFDNVYMLVDALDESPRDSKRQGVLKAIDTIRSWSLPSVHLLTTSRNELDIRESLDPASNQELIMRNSELDRDIGNFVSYQVNNDPKLQRWKARHEEIQEKLTTSAQGVFRYVECQFNALRRARNRNQLDECLRTLPRDLDQTYERILSNVEEEYADDVRRILTLLCVSTRPLTLNELIDAHAIDLSDPPCLDRDGRAYEQEDIIDICLGLIEVTPKKGTNKQSSVRIAHFSVQEYLESDRILQQQTKRFAVQREPANTEMATIYLIYLLEVSLSGAYSMDALYGNFPLYDLAVKNWLHHYANSGEAKPRIEQLVVRLYNVNKKFFMAFMKRYEWPERSITHFAYRDVPPDKIPSLLYYAALLGLESALDEILLLNGKGASFPEAVNAQVGHLGTALQAASFRGNEKVVQMLLDKGANINAQGGYYGTALQAASRRGDSEKLVHMLLDQGADANLQGGHYGNALQAASYRGNEKVVQMLLDQGANVNAQGGYYGNSLQAASARPGNKKVVHMLLDQGADVNAQGGYYGNALQATLSERGDGKVMQMLLDQGADINAQGGYWGNALQAASSQPRNEETVQILLDQGAGASINAQGGHFGTALQAASSRLGYEKVVQILLDQGADVNVRGGRFRNSLHGALFVGNEKVVLMLLDRGADINEQGGYYGNPLQIASSRPRNQKLVQILLDQGANVNAQGGYWGNALQAASSRPRNEETVQLLLDQGADVNAQGGYWGNALQAASSQPRNEGTVQILLDHGANVNAQGGKHGNALQAALDQGFANVVEMLQDRGAKLTPNL